MQADSILSMGIQQQLQGTIISIDPLSLYIDELLDDDCETIVIERPYINLSTIIKTQEVDKINNEINLTNTLNLLRINHTLNKNTHLYQSILNQIDLYFLTGRTEDE